MKSIYVVSMFETGYRTICTLNKFIEHSVVMSGSQDDDNIIVTASLHIESMTSLYRLII